jgi:dienelactone hydrolase
MKACCKHSLALISALLFASVVVVAGPDYAAPGPYPVGEGVTTVTRNLVAETFDALVYYPADAADAQAVAAVGAPHPVIVFGHGFLTPPQLYRATCRHLASWGFVVVAPQSALEPFPDHAEYGRDMQDAANHLIALNRVSGQRFFERVLEMTAGFTGHSMGGGAALLANATFPSRPVTAVLAAAETRPSAIAAAAQSVNPILFITGSEDRFTPNAFHTGPMFRNAVNAAWFDIRGGYHCGFLLPPLPQAVCDEGSISRFEQVPRAHRLLTAWFRFMLRDDLAAWDEIWGPTGDFDRGLTVRRSPVANIRPASRAITVPPGQTRTMEVAVANRNDSYHFFALAAESSTYAVEVTPASLAIPPGTEGTFTVSVTAPISGQPRRGVALLRASVPDDPRWGGDYQWLLLRTGR